MYHSSRITEIEIRELIDFAVILFNRSLYQQCADVLAKARKKARKNDSLELLLEIYKWEKNIIIHTLGRDNQERVNTVVNEVQDVNNRINNINRFTNLAARLNSVYIKGGFIRNEEELRQINEVYHAFMPEVEEDTLSFHEKLYLYELQVGYYFFIYEFEKGYEYAKKWVALFDDSQSLILSNLEMYVRGLNNLMIAQYKLYQYHEFLETHKKLKTLRNWQGLELNENIQIKLFKYIFVHEFNRFFMEGDFDAGVMLINKIKGNLEDYVQQLDRHSRIIMYYKIACLYFGIGDYREVIFWLNKIINLPNADLREDIHCFSRILNLVSHYELGNMDVIEYYLRSTYRFLLKKDDLHLYQQYILDFMKRLTKNITEEELVGRFEALRVKLLPLQNSRFEKRAFLYFDIISWLECKIEHVPVQKVVQRKAAAIIGESIYQAQ